MSALEKWNRRNENHVIWSGADLEDMADAMRDELLEEIACWKDGCQRREDECEALADRLNKMEESYVRTINRDGEYANGLLAEVERLTWMLDRCLHDFMETVEGEWGLHDDESYESWLADLARRWEERRD